jgi:hypothetical protein
VLQPLLCPLDLYMELDHQLVGLLLDRELEWMLGEVDPSKK